MMIRYIGILDKNADGGKETSVSFSIGYGIFSVSLSPGKTGDPGRYTESPYINTAVNSYAMGNSPQAVKESAKFVTYDNDMKD